jgi:hypothetical protein
MRDTIDFVPEPPKPRLKFGDDFKALDIGKAFVILAAERADRNNVNSLAQHYGKTLNRKFGIKVQKNGDLLVFRTQDPDKSEPKVKGRIGRHPVHETINVGEPRTAPVKLAIPEAQPIDEAPPASALEGEPISIWAVNTLEPPHCESCGGHPHPNWPCLPI